MIVLVTASFLVAFVGLALIVVVILETSINFRKRRRNRLRDEQINRYNMGALRGTKERTR